MPHIDGQMMIAPSGPGPGGGTIPLSTLMDYIIQRTYHELNILSELLPRKTDMERKIEIVQFASRTRQLFVRLLALVKWANSAGKVDKCAMISNFLDQQSLFFVETADMLARMARETLLQARLPCFSIPCAIDVLTTGSYPRLPACIKEKIVPPDPISYSEKNQTLVKLNQIIEHRLVTGELPSHMRRPIIENGRVKFQVQHEFEVTLTLMGDGPNIPWRLLDIEILVEDPETGDGIALIHSLQVNYIHELLQSRLMDNDKPLHDLYNVLHSFCQSLQLEVLHSQAQRLIHQRLGENVRIEEYIPGRSMILSYWRDGMKKENKPFQQIFKLNIQVDVNDPSKPLQISHFPQIQGSESTKVAQAIRSDHLSLEKLLIHTIQVRGLSKLKELERELRLIVPGPCETRDLPTVLYIPVLYPCMESERLSIAIDVQRGYFLVSLCLKETNLTADIQDSINSDKRDLRRLLSKLRLWIALQRCQKSIQHIHTSCLEHLPFTNLSGHPLEALGTNKLFIKLPKQQNYYLVVEATETYKRCVDYKYYMLEVQQGCFEGATLEEIDSLPKMYMKAGHLVELEKFACTHGSGAKVHDVEAEDPNPLTRKRKLFKKDNSGPSQKKLCGSPYFVPELPHILALCEDRLPFVLLGRELEKRGIAYSDIEVDGEGIGLSLSILGLLPSEGIKPEVLEKLQADLLSCKFRIQRKGIRPTWILEVVLCNPPVQSTNPKEAGPVHRVFYGYDMSGHDAAEKTVQSLLEDWSSLANLYQLVSEFADIYSENDRLLTELEVKNYTYKRLVMAYGPTTYNRCYTTTVYYKSVEKKDQKITPDKKFHVVFGTHGQTSIANCHMITASHLEQVLNERKSLAYLAQLLIDTWSPMCSIGKLSTTPMMGLTNRPNTTTPGFTFLPQSATHVRVVYRETYCIDIHCRGNRVVALRDGAFSMFDTSKVVEPLMPIPGLKAFLNLFVDESMNTSQSRRRSTTEDDHPPSPMGMDTMDSFMTSSQHPTGSPASKGLTFKSPLTPPSNPTTPASPAGSKLPHPSPASNFPLASPPSLGPGISPSPSNIMAPSPGNPNLHVPSPGSFVPAPSPSSLGVHMPSPATQFISPQGMLDGTGGGSPFPTANLAMPSPGTKNWPASPSVPGPSPRTHTVTSPPQGPGSMMSPPSRSLPQKSWAASIPTLISHDAFDKLLSPCKLPGTQYGSPLLSPLERFLGCVFLRRHIQRVVQSEESLQQLQCAEAGVVLFKVESLQYKVSLHPTHMQCLTLKVTPNPEFQSGWETEELQILEKFFEIKAASSPYKANAITAFGHLLAAPMRVLKDFIQIMKLEMYPNTNMKWNVQWCLTIPNGSPLCIDVGVAAVVLKEKILFVLQLTYNDPPPGKEPETVVVPIVYNKAANETQLVDQHDAKTNILPAPSHTHTSIKEMLKKFHQYNTKPNDCSIYPAICEVLTNQNCTPIVAQQLQPGQPQPQAVQPQQQQPGQPQQQPGQPPQQ